MYTTATAYERSRGSAGILATQNNSESSRKNFRKHGQRHYPEQRFYSIVRGVFTVSTTALLILVFLLPTTDSFSSSRHPLAALNREASKLYEDLLSDYNKLVRPVDNTSSTLIVTFKLKLSQLLDVVSAIRTFQP